MFVQKKLQPFYSTQPPISVANGTAMSLPQLKVVRLSSDGDDCQLQHNQALFVIKGCSIWVVGIVIFLLIEGDHPQFLLVGLYMTSVIPYNIDLRTESWYINWDEKILLIDL